MTPERPVAFAAALDLVRPVSRRRLYWTARSVFLSDQAHVRPSTPSSEPSSERGQILQSSTASPKVWMCCRSSGCRTRAEQGEHGDEETEIPRAVAGDEERLASRHFDALEPGELAQLYRLMARLELAPPLKRTRRYERGRHGRQIDLRRTLRGGLRSGGEPIRMARRQRRVQRRRLVMVCDISGSMEPYARAYLQLLAAAAGSGPSVEAFVFATRLTRLTRALRGRHPDRAIQRAAAAAPDWSSGTRIGDALKAFNDRHEERPRDGARRGRGDRLRPAGSAASPSASSARWRGSGGSRTGSCGSTRA